MGTVNLFECIKSFFQPSELCHHETCTTGTFIFLFIYLNIFIQGILSDGICSPEDPCSSIYKYTKIFEFLIAIKVFKRNPDSRWLLFGQQWHQTLDDVHKFKFRFTGTQIL